MRKVVIFIDKVSQTFIPIFQIDLSWHDAKMFLLHTQKGDNQLVIIGVFYA